MTGFTIHLHLIIVSLSYSVNVRPAKLVCPPAGSRLTAMGIVCTIQSSRLRKNRV